MKAKNLLCLAILTSLVLGMIPLGRAQSSFYFDPASMTAPPPNVGDTITLTIRISSPTADLFLYVMDVAWDPAVFAFVSQAAGGALDTGPGSYLFIPGDLFTPGLLNDVTVGSQTGTGVSIPPQPNSLLVLQFRVLGFTDPVLGSDITIPFARYLDTPGNEYVPPTSPFHFMYRPPPPTSPIAAFTPPSSTVAYVGTPVHFDGTGSTQGYDPDPTPITDYAWNFGDGSPIVHGATQDYSYSTPGDYSVTLTVTAPGVPPTDPRYGTTVPDFDTETHIIHIIPVPIGPAIDVYTERNGIGPGVASDAFGPQEEITIYALVTWNLDPVANKLVAFEVKADNGTVIMTRTAASNMDGIATVTMRIPWTGMEAEQWFGQWTIYGAVDLAEQIVTDYCPFLFGYLLQTTGLRTTDAMMVTKTTFLKGESLFVEVTINNISFNSKIATITVTVYDDAGVPIGFNMVPGTAVPPGSSMVWNFDITIPYWRFKGVGRVYVNIFTAMPQVGGVPYCPEASTLFTLG